MESLIKQFEEVEREIKNCGNDYAKVEAYLENYLVLNQIEAGKLAAYNHVLKVCEKVNRKDDFDSSNVTNLTKRIVNFKINEKDKFINSFYRRPLNTPIEAEVYALWLIKNNKTEEFIKLVENNRNLRFEAQQSDSTLLIHAVKLQKLEIVKFLIQRKANIHALDSHGRDLIKIAALICEQNVLEYLIDIKLLGINSNNNLNVMLTNGNIDDIDLAYTDNFGATILHYIAARGRIDVLKRLETKLNQHEKSIYYIKDKSGLTCFDRATRNNCNLETLKYLVYMSEIEMDYSNFKIKSVIIWSFYSCSLDIIKWLLLNVKSIPKDVFKKDFLLHEVNLETDECAVKSFIEFFLNESNLKEFNIDPFDINSRNITGNTLIMELAGGYYRALSIQFTEFFIEKGADIKIRNYQDQNIIHLAAATGNKELIEYLCNHKGLSLTHSDKVGNTALIKASESGYFEIVKYLVMNKNSSTLISKTNSYGFSALDAALSKGFHNISRYLSDAFFSSNIPRIISTLSQSFDSFSYKNYLLHPLIIKTSEDFKNKIFIIRGRDRGKTAWHYVDVEPWSIEVLKIQPSGVNIDVTDYGVILRSGWGEDATNKDKLEVELIEEQRAYFDKLKNSILKNNVYMIERSGLNDYKDYYGANLLHLSSAYGRLDVILWLYFNKFDINTADDCGNTALYYAALNFQYDAIILLKLLGLNHLYFGECKFLSGHIEKYFKTVRKISSLNHYVLIASLLNGVKAFNKCCVNFENLEQVKHVLNVYFQKINDIPHFKLEFGSNIR